MTALDTIQADGFASRLAFQGVTVSVKADANASPVSLSAIVGSIVVRQFDEPGGRVAREVVQIQVPRTAAASGGLNSGNCLADPQPRQTIAAPTGPAGATEGWRVWAVISKRPAFAVLECVREGSEIKGNPKRFVQRGI
jgi:hypothetical protein